MSSIVAGRYRMILVISVGLFLLLWFRLIDLQLVHHRYYADIALDNRIQLAVDIARRGLIRDRDGEILALNSPSYSVYLMRGKAVPLDAVVAGIDPVAVDAWSFEHLLERGRQYPDYLYRAEEKGGGSVDYRGRIGGDA